MIAIQNLEKYFDDHPELADQKDAILDAAREKTEAGGTVITGTAAAEILGGLTDDFFREVNTSTEHQNIGIAALRKFNA